MFRLEESCSEGKPGSEAPECDIGEEQPGIPGLGQSEDSQPESDNSMAAKSKEVGGNRLTHGSAAD